MNKKVLYPPANIGIIGGGQLGKMMSQCAKKMGYKVTVLDPVANGPAMQVSDKGVVASYDDKGAIMELARKCDVITFEYEHINADYLIALEEAGHKVIPSGRTLKLIQDKYVQKEALQTRGLLVPKFKKIQNEQDIYDSIEEFGLPLVLKKSREGYDGKGNIIIKNYSQVKAALQKFHTGELMIEEFIHFQKELSVVVACDGTEMKLYPVVENIHEESILRLTKVPAHISAKLIKEVELVAEKVMDCLQDVGIFCIELFLSKDNRIYINEIAPRPHNSGHYTIEGCETSQYEQLMRIVTGLPMGSPKLTNPSAMVNILGNDSVEGSYRVEGLEEVLSEDNTYIHLYGKHTTATLKKIGHITVCSDTTEAAVEKALDALEKISIKARKEGMEYECKN